MNTQQQTAQALRDKAAHHENEKEESFQRCDTDGFLSQWAHGKSAELMNLKADIVEAGGTYVFTGLYEGSRRVKAKRFTRQNKFSYQSETQWVLHDDEADLIERRGRKFLPSGPRSRVLKQLGLREAPERARAYAFMNGHGHGLSGNCWAQAARDGDKWGTNAVELTGEDDE